MNKNTSATATVVTRCHVSVALSSLDLVRMFQKLESIEVALFCDDFLGLVTDMRGCSSFFWQPVYITLVYCGSFASVHRHKPASPSRVSALHPTSLHCCFSDSSLQAPSCVRVANRDCPCTDGSDLVGLDQSSWKQLHQTTTGIRCPAGMRASPLPMIATRKSTPRLSEVSVSGELSAGQ